MRNARSRHSAPLAALVLLASAAFAAPDDNGEAHLTVSDALLRSKEYVSKMQQTVRDISGLQQQAKKQKDIIRLNCVNEKMAQVKGHMAVADRAVGNLNDAIGKADEEARVHEFQRVDILYQKVLVLGTEARNCVGDDLSYIGATTVTLDTDPSIPQRDYTGFDLPGLDTSRPPMASSF